MPAARVRRELAGKRVAVVGLGVSNLAVARFLLDAGAAVSVFDRKSPEDLGERYRALAGEPVDWVLGDGYLGELEARAPGFDRVFLTPGMRKDLPELEAARRAGAAFDSEMGLFFRCCRAPIVGITGSAGKTTTTALVGRMLEAAGRRVFVGGNIGRPLLPLVDAIGPDDAAVLEMSSFQLQMLDRSPQVGVLLNVRPNHLDMHAGFEEYFEAKKNVFRFQGPADTAVLNAEDPAVAGCAAEAPGRVAWFGRAGEVARGAFLRGGRVVVRGLGAAPSGRDGGAGEVVAGDAAELVLPGAHNVANALAALAAAAAFGADPRRAWAGVRGFRGVEHRLEFVRERDGVRFYNDSIATAPDRTLAALASFEAPLVLLAGGYDKKIPFDALGERIAERVRVLVLLGRTAPKIRAAVEEAAARRGVRGPEILEAPDFREAVALAAGAARPGDVVLLSPACASYDMFNNYEERGRLFKELVLAL